MKIGGASVSAQSVVSPRCIRLPSPPSTLNAIPSFKFNRVSPLLHSSARSSPNLRIHCSPAPPGENDSRAVLDAFFLGKAVAEALTERIESTVGEFLSTVGRLQAEQQKQVQEFQVEVLERAKKAKEKAAREAMQEEQGLVSSPIVSDASSVGNVNGSVTVQGSEAANEDPLSGVSTQE